MGGQHPFRDIPRYVKMMERGMLNLGPVVTGTYGLSDAMEGFRKVADRTTVSAAIVMAEFQRIRPALRKAPAMTSCTPSGTWPAREPIT